jgi:hypothetical protein
MQIHRSPPCSSNGGVPNVKFPFLTLSYTLTERSGINGLSSRTQSTQSIDRMRLAQRQCSINCQKLQEGCHHHKSVASCHPSGSPDVNLIHNRKARKTRLMLLSASSPRLGQIPGCSAARCSLTCVRSIPFATWCHFSQA